MTKVLTRNGLVWIAFAVAVFVPIAAAATSPLLAWREPIYIAAGFAGIVALALLLVQPLLIGGYLPGLSPLARRRLHRLVGAGLFLAVVLHVIGLWITSPPDVIDVLLFASPTPFSVWGVVAMWAVIVTFVLALLRKPLAVRPSVWRMVHSALAAIIVVGTVVHALLIEGTMEPVSKAVLCVMVAAATLKVFFDLRVWALRRLRKP